MRKNILMPASMAGGKLTRWLKQVGDRVQPGDLVAEVESDKASLEIESPYQGTLVAIQVAEGTTDITEDQVLAIIEE